MIREKQILSNYLKLFSGEVFSKVLGYLSLIIVVKYVDVDTFGQYSILLVLIGLCSLFIEYGLNAASVYFLAKYKNIKKTVNSNLIIRSTLFISTITPLYFLFSFYFEFQINLIYFGLLILSNMSVVFSYDYIFRYYEKMQIIAKINIYSASIFLILVLVILGKINNIYGVIICYAISKLSRLLMSIYFYHKYTHTFQKPLDVRNYRKIEILNYATPIFVSSIMIWIYYQSDTLILEYFRGKKDVAYYNAAYKFILLFATIQVIYNQALFPMLSKLCETSIYSTKIFVEKYFNIIFYITAPLFFITMYLSKWTIITLYGPQYSESIMIFNLLLFSMVFVFNESVTAPLMIASGRSKIHMIIVGVGALINVSLNYFLIPDIGMQGAALSTIIAEAVIFSLFAYYAYKLLNLKIVIFLKVFIAQIMLLIFYYSQI